MKRIFLLLGLTVVLALPCLAKAEVIPDLSQYLDTEISRTDEAVASTDNQAYDGSPTVASNQSEDGWFFKRIWLRIRFTAGIKIPAIFSLKFIPDTELLWERPYPNGWVSYKH